MDFYEYTHIVKDLVEELQRQNDAQKGQQDQTNDMMSGMKMPNMKMPSMKMPNLKTPSLK